MEAEYSPALQRVATFFLAAVVLVFLQWLILAMAASLTPAQVLVESLPSTLNSEARSTWVSQHAAGGWKVDQEHGVAVRQTAPEPSPAVKLFIRGLALFALALVGFQLWRYRNWVEPPRVYMGHQPGLQ